MRVIVDRVSVSFDGRVVMRVDHAEFCAGAVSGIVGPSGSGKSTLLSVIAGIRRPDTGCVRLNDGMRSSTISSMDVSWVPQGAYLLPDRTVIDNVAVGALADGSRLDIAQTRALDALAQVRLDVRATARASQLSGGEVQRVALARAMCTSRRIILADEPTASLDRASAAVVADILAELDSNRIIIVATHDPALVERCNSVVDVGAQ